MSITLAGILLGVIAIIASLGPARSAVAIDPMVAARDE